MIIIRERQIHSTSQRKGLLSLAFRISSVALIATVLALFGCRLPQESMEASPTQQIQPSDTLVPTSTKTPEPTEVPPTDTQEPTEVFPTNTLIPTNTPTITNTPRPPLEPEQSAESIEQVAGRWLFNVMGGGEGDPAIFTLAEDGTHSTDAIGGYHAGMNMGTGTYWFEDDLMYLHSMHCTSPKGEFFECTATYRVYVSMGEDGPGALRFVAIEDPHPDRKKSLHGKTLYPAPPEE